MPVQPMFTTQVTITTKSINNDSVACVFNTVIGLHFDYLKGMINVVDSEQGSFFFPMQLVTTVTYTVTGGTIVIAIS